jgi:hypothetical protein
MLYRSTTIVDVFSANEVQALFAEETEKLFMVAW